MNRLFASLSASLPTALLSALALTACGTAALPTTGASASPVHCTVRQVEIIVQHQTGHIIERCVSVSGSLNALTAMQRSRLQTGTVMFSGLGAAVCQIDHEPATYSPKCFDNGNYWAMFVAHGHGKWATPATGVSSTNLSPGDTLGWRYESQSSSAAPAQAP